MTNPQKIDKHFREKINRPRNIGEFIEFFENYYEERTGERLTEDDIIENEVNDSLMEEYEPTFDDKLYDYGI